ncbi:MAG TPA: hypothetical protein VFZ40_00115 [Pyrinomonadaceae bacterium]
MRLLLTCFVIITAFYTMTGFVFFEGSFDGAFVVKPYPMYQVVFGGGEAGAWARHHPGQPPPWFMQDDLKVIFRFDWEQGHPARIGAYIWGYLATLLFWAVIALIVPVKLLMMIRARFDAAALSIR